MSGAWGVTRASASRSAAATGLSHGENSRRIAAEAIRRGHRQIAPDAARVRRWIDGDGRARRFRPCSPRWSPTRSASRSPPVIPG